MARARILSQQFNAEDFGKNGEDATSNSSSEGDESDGTSSSRSWSFSSSTGSNGELSSSSSSSGEDDAKGGDKATTTFVTGLIANLPAGRGEGMVSRRSEVKPAAVCVRHWQAHTEAIQTARIINNKVSACNERSK